MGTQTIKMPADTTIVSLNITPLQGGQGRNGKAYIDAPAAGVMLQGNDQQVGPTPAANDAGWYDLLTTTANGAKVQEIILPRYIRRGAAGGTGPITIEGIQ